MVRVSTLVLWDIWNYIAYSMDILFKISFQLGFLVLANSLSKIKEVGNSSLVQVF